MDLLAIAELYMKRKEEEFSLEEAVRQIRAMPLPNYLGAVLVGTRNLQERVHCSIPLPSGIANGRDYQNFMDETVSCLHKYPEGRAPCTAPPAEGARVVVGSEIKAAYTPNYLKERKNNFPPGTTGMVWKSSPDKHGVLVEFSAEKKYQWSYVPNWSSGAYNVRMLNNVGYFDYSELLIYSPTLKEEAARYGGGREALEKIVAEEFGKAEASTEIPQYEQQVRQLARAALEKMRKAYTPEQRAEWLEKALVNVRPKIKAELLCKSEEK